MTIGDMLHRSASRYGAKPALLFKDSAITYAELDASTTALAAWFLAQGFGKGDRIGIYRSNSIDTAILFLACFKAGLIAVCVNVRLKAEEAAYVLKNAYAAVCFTEPALAAAAHHAAKCPVHEALPVTTPPSAPLPAVLPDDPCILFCTSGTTARPKGVLHSHRTILESTRVLASYMNSEDVVLVPTQMTHVSGMHCTMLPALLSGGLAVLLENFTATGAAEAIERHRVSCYFTLPLFIHLLFEEQSVHPRDLSSVRVLVSSGDTVSGVLQQRSRDVFGVAIYECLSMTETVPITINRPDKMRPGSIGSAWPGSSVRIVDRDGIELPLGEIGEIVIKSPTNCLGYWNHPEATAALLRDGWLHTGDLGRCDADGFFYFEGRLKQIIVRGGSNISPQQVEEVLLSHPLVRESGVVGAPDPILGERVIAFVCARDAGLTEHELRAFAGERIADYKIPERIVFLPDLPKGITGKVDRRGLKDMLTAHPHLLAP
jgi:long-chain acyl-CoA synthetase